jgi:nicotinamidase-related amidase
MSAKRPATAALIVIDVQKAIDDQVWAIDGERNNPEAEANIARLLDAWRDSARPIFHVRHDSTFPDSPYRPGQTGNDFKPEAAPIAGETVIPKRTNSAFIGTDLEERLCQRGIKTLVIAGVITNNSVEATVRMAGNLGFETYLVEDACFTFGRRDFHGRKRSADEVHAMSVANMAGEYCTAISTNDALAASPSERIAI